jgi:tetratricopeptide (TPR) repeat protein
MDRARGTWVFSIDADERLECAPTAVADLRAGLAGSPPVDRYIIPLYDLLGSKHAPVRSADGKPMARLFRRRRCHWEGAIHEQPNARPGTPAVRNEHLETVSFLHRGYLDEIVAEKDKWARNLRVAVGSMPSLPTDSKGCYDLGRSLHSTGYRGEALSLFERAVELADNEVIARASLQFMVQTLLELGLSDDAERCIGQLRDVSDTDHVARYLEGWLRVEQGRWADAIAALDDLVDYNDTFTSYTEDRRLTALALAHRGGGDRAAAAEAATRALASNPQAGQAWSVLIDTLDAAPGALARLAAAIGSDRLLPTFLTLGQFPVDVRDRLADELWQLRPGDLTVVALASKFAVELEPDRMALWAARLRGLGMASLCPVAQVAQDGARTVDERVLAVAAALHLSDDDELRTTLEALVPLVLDDALGGLLDRVLSELIGAAECFIIAAATSAPRTLRLLAPLVDHGHRSESLALLDHATDLDAAGARRWLDAHPALADQLRAAATELGRNDLLPVLDQAA